MSPDNASGAYVLKSAFLVMSVFGTRPEAVKMAPIVHELESRKISQMVCVTGQHREMLHQVLRLFDIRPNCDLDIMTVGQTLEDITSRVINGMSEIFAKEKPDLVLVHGDPTSAMATSLAAFYHQIPVGHVEAGLRTDSRYDPFPEEMNRRLIGQLATHHFAPTLAAANNLIRDGVAKPSIYVTGNTVIDALLLVAKQNRPFEAASLQHINFDLPVVLVTTHRRENLGGRMDNIFGAIQHLAKENPNIQFVFPVHLNPKVREQVHRFLHEVPNVYLTEPLSYSDLAGVMKRCRFVMTDSGGIQEEAPALGKPVIVLRETTERPEGIEAGTAVLAGSEDKQKIIDVAMRLLRDENYYQQMARANNPYGDGTASKQIVDQIERLAAMDRASLDA
jgi:UDP-N-acetylglucosamine 2-epimerase (non-hydrolysing)